MKRRGQYVFPPQERVEHLSTPEPNSGCWLWLGAVRNGYGRLIIGSRSDKTRRSVSAHRLSYETYIGPIPSGLEVCHKCDVRCCVNPAHLFVGTRQDNVDDREAKGRNKAPPIFRGRLSLDTIRTIRSSPLSSRRLSARIGVSDSYIREVRRGEYRPALPEDGA